MENLEKNIEPVNAVSHKNSSRTKDNLESYGDFITLGTEVITEDLASFFIVNLVITAKIRKISEIKSYFPKNAEFETVVEQVLLRMEKANYIQIEGDSILLISKIIDFGDKPEQLINFLPSLFRAISNRVLLNELHNPELRKARKEMVRFFALPDHPEVNEEIRALNSEYKAKLNALQDKSAVKNLDSNQVRIIGIVDSILEPEDFI